MKTLLIWGAGDQGTVTLDCAMAMNIYSRIDLLDFKETGHRDILNHIVYYKHDTELEKFLKSYDEVIVATGDNHLREQKLLRLISMGISIATIIHPTAVISSFAKVSEGCTVLANAVIHTNAVIGMGCIVNTAAVVEHDCTIEEFVNISPNFSMAGHARIGKKSFLGIGSTMIDKIVVGKEAVVGAGAVVIGDVQDGVVVAGVPAKIIRKQTAGARNRKGIHMNKQAFNLHTHTSRCGHAEGLDIQYIESALQAGFSMLGFSEHIPFVEIRRSDCRMFYEQKDEYISSIRKLQKEYSDRIEIKVGFEVEFLEDHIDHIMFLRKNCDYMILGQHCKYIGYEYDCYCSEEDILDYAGQIEQALSKNFVTYVAHPDYFMLGRRSFSKNCEEATHRIAKASIQYDVPLEINLNGYHYGKKSYTFFNRPGVYEERYPYPLREFWEIVSSYGCKVVYGYDAHTPIAFLEDDRERKAMEILKDIPLNFCDSISLK